MNPLQSMHGLYRHMEWADSIVWNTIFSSSNAITDSILKERLLHIHYVQYAFLQVWRGLHFDRGSFDFTELAHIARWAQQYHSDAEAYLAELDDETLARPVVMPWAQEMVQQRFGRDAATPSLAETLLQVAMHSTYHRGQVNTRLRELGVEPPLTDFIAWIWLDRPRPDWPNTPL